MKTLIVMMLMISSITFASEKEGADYCSVARKQKEKIYREQSQINRDFLSKDEEASWSSPETGSFNCEEVPDDRTIYLRRYEALSREMVQVERDIERYCPRSYPE